LSKSSRNSSKSPRFFCESCGTEVPRDAKNCPKCGRRFASVLCPSCGFSGEEDSFKGGCPVCGYSSGAWQYQDTKAAELPEIKKPAGALPVWVYLLTAAVFTAIMAALFFTVFK